jgi:putative peptide zinc metalloprotease protein
VALPGEQAVRLHELSLVDEGDHVIVGDPQAGVFVAVRPVGGVVIRALLAGASMAEAAAAAERFARQPVDVTSFITRLDRLGFLAGPQDAGRRPASTAALQQWRWLAAPAPERVRWLFGRGGLVGVCGPVRFRPWP